MDVEKQYEWSKKSKRYKVNYFAALGELFKVIKDDHEMETVSECQSNTANEKK